MFRTRQLGDGPHVVRTSGTVVRSATGLLRLPFEDAIRHAETDPPPDCARGKVAIVAQSAGELGAVCYQVSDCRTQAHVVACCNATAAAAAALGADADVGEHLTLAVTLPRVHPIRVEARVSHPHRTSADTDFASIRRRTVEQRWREVPFAIHAQARIDGRSCVVCASPLNDYLVIRTRAGEDAADFPVDEAVALWRRFGLDRAPLLSRMAVVQADALVPRAKFFTCGDRAHPSAPLTGLAVLAFSAQRLRWRTLAAAGRVATATGIMALPRVERRANDTADIVFPALVVELDASRATHQRARA